MHSFGAGPFHCHNRLKGASSLYWWSDVLFSFSPPKCAQRVVTMSLLTITTLLHGALCDHSNYGKDSAEAVLTKLRQHSPRTSKQLEIFTGRMKTVAAYKTL